jgi:ABC-2 type transport system permease protein
LVLLGGTFFSALSLIIAFMVKTRERFMGMGQLLTMPLFFASNAIYPVTMMPDWLKVIAHVNPLTYEVDGVRALMLSQGASTYGVGTDFAVLMPAAAALVAVCGWLYPRIVR